MASQDPIGHRGGDSNLYAYVYNDPVNEIDPSGYFLPMIAGCLLRGALETAAEAALMGELDCMDAGDWLAGVLSGCNPFKWLGKAAKIAKTAKRGKSFDQARREAFKNAEMTDPSKVQFSKFDEATGTVVEFKGAGGAKIGYDGPHKLTPGQHHDTQHISWQSAGKRGSGGRKRGNIPYEGPRHPSRPDRKDQ